MPKFAVFAVPFSPNLGDGVIFECLSYGIRAQLPDAVVIPVDLAGRQNYGEVSVKNRKLILRVLPYMPLWLRHALVRVILGRKIAQSCKRWAEIVAGCDAAIIGGGQLFADADLNFPLKIAAVAKVVASKNVPLGVFSVGAAGTWSARGARLFRTVANANLRFISGRDPFSTQTLTEALFLRPGTEIAVTPDPGLLASRRFPRVGPQNGVALCVAAEELLSYHADRPMTGAEGGVAAMFVRIALACIALGHDVKLFTNGADEDELALNAVFQRTELAEVVADGRLTRLPRPGTPEDLCKSIAGAKAVVAHRLHACIVAYSYRIPVLGLTWDRKVDSFFEQVGRLDLLISEDDAEPATIAGRIALEIEKGLPEADHARQLDAAQAAIAPMLTRLLEKP